jgi:hypothetical protein
VRNVGVSDCDVPRIQEMMDQASTSRPTGPASHFCWHCCIVVVATRSRNCMKEHGDTGLLRYPLTWQGLLRYSLVSEYVNMGKFGSELVPY